MVQEVQGVEAFYGMRRGRKKNDVVTGEGGDGREAVAWWEIRRRGGGEDAAEMETDGHGLARDDGDKTAPAHCTGVVGRACTRPP